MKKDAIAGLLALTLAGAAAAGAGHAHEHAHAPLHGGVVVEARDVDYELVAKPGVLQLYLRDHGKPMDVSAASAKLTLLTGGAKQEVTLAPAGDRLEAKGAFQVRPGTKAVAVVSNGGKLLGSVRFSLK